MKFLQKLGKSMMLPIAVLPICGILMGIGYIMCPAAIQGGDVSGAVQIIGHILVKAGGAVIDNMSILFVIGVALGMSDDNSGVACLSGMVSWLTITVLLSTKALTDLVSTLPIGEVGVVAFSKIQNPFIGILCGLIGAICYNKFKKVKMPDTFAFFSGKRFVAIATMLVSVLMAMVLLFVWPVLFAGLYKLGTLLVSAGGIGAGIYAFLNRLLIPTGLHHALNNVFWFDTIGIGDLTNFWAGKTSQDVGYSLGCYMSGFFPCMMFGIPGAALAIYRSSANKKKAAGALLSVAICAFVCGLTEPFEFMFMFLAFPLYVIYSFLYGVFTAITYYTGFRAGFSFSAGAIDLGFSASLPAAAKTWLIIPLGLAAFVVFYLVFRIYLKCTKKAIIANDAAAADAPELQGDSRFTAIASCMLAAVGGAANVASADCCATRLRLELQDGSLVDKEKAKQGGALGVFVKGSACQIVIGTTVQQVLEEFQRLCKEPPQEKVKLKDKIKKRIQGLRIRHGQSLSLSKEDKPSSGAVFPETSDANDEAIEDLSATTFAYTVKDPVGLHARPAGQIAKLMKEANASGTITLGEKQASMTSVLEMMGLGIKQGDRIEVSVGDGKILEELKCLLKEVL